MRETFVGIEKCHTYAALLEARTFIENIRQFNIRHASISWRQSGKVQDIIGYHGCKVHSHCYDNAILLLLLFPLCVLLLYLTKFSSHLALG